MDQLISLYERLIRIPRWQKWIIIVLLGVVIAGLMYYFTIFPLKQELNRKKKELESLKLNVNRLKIVEKRRKQIIKELNQLKRQIKSIEKKLPTGREDVSQILRSITDADSGMILKYVKKKRVKQHKYYVEYPYEVELVGTYPEFIKWCERLSRANRIINFGPMRISAFDSSRFESKAEREATLTVKLEVKAFTLTE